MPRQAKKARRGGNIFARNQPERCHRQRQKHEYRPHRTQKRGYCPPIRIDIQAPVNPRQAHPQQARDERKVSGDELTACAPKVIDTIGKILAKLDLPFG